MGDGIPIGAGPGGAVFYHAFRQSAESSRFRVQSLEFKVPGFKFNVGVPASRLRNLVLKQEPGWRGFLPRIHGIATK